MFVARKADGTIYGAWTVRQFAGQEELADSDLPLVSFLNPKLPNVRGFIDELKVAMGGIVASNALAKAYPLFHPALDKGVWADVQALISDAKSTGVLSPAQYATFQSLAIQYHLPVTLP